MDNNDKNKIMWILCLIISFKYDYDPHKIKIFIPDDYYYCLYSYITSVVVCDDIIVIIILCTVALINCNLFKCII